MESEQTREQALNDLTADAISSFQNYARHFEWCAFRGQWTQGAVNCNCGYTSTLKELMDRQIELKAFGAVSRDIR